MSKDYDYKELLHRARETLPETIHDRERFEIPNVDVLIEGKNTVFRNFAEIAEVINREGNQFLAYLLGELGRAGVIDGRRVIFKGRVAGSLIEERIKSFVNDYVLCSECGRPDTRLVKEGRIMILVCDACGAHRPVRVRKGRMREKELREGEVYELMIEDVGRKGDGIAKVGGYIIYVAGTTKGTTVKVLIQKIRGTVAFGTIARE